MNPRIHSTSRREDGQTLVEFAIAFPIQLFVTMGIIQLSMIFMAKQVVNYAAFAAARAELVKQEDTDAGMAAAIVCTAIAGPTTKADNRVTREEYPLIQLPGWGLLMPPPPAARRVSDPGDELVRGGGRHTYYTAPTARSDSTFLAAGGPDKSSFAQAKTYVYRLDGGAWAHVTHQSFAPDPSTLPMLDQVRSAVGSDERTIVVAVAHDFELVFPFVGEMFAFLTTLTPGHYETREEQEIPTLNDATERWGAPHITLVDVGIQYRSWEEYEEE